MVQKERTTISIPKEVFDRMNKFSQYASKVLNKNIRMISSNELLTIILDLAHQQLYTKKKK